MIVQRNKLGGGDLERARPRPDERHAPRKGGRLVSPPAVCRRQSGNRAGTHPSRTVGGATGNAGTDIAGLLVMPPDSPTEATKSNNNRDYERAQHAKAAWLWGRRQRRAELVRAPESLVDGKDAYPRVTLEGEIAAVSAAINQIDRELALPPPKRTRRQAA